ncbi:hypothetical protein D8I24_5498 (plasmid) [Cupriavidus necator H850]|nr:hypothetical protein D8I24_5498 [Cupriavidus necator H850]
MHTALLQVTRGVSSDALGLAGLAWSWHLAAPGKQMVLCQPNDAPVVRPSR